MKRVLLGIYDFMSAHKKAAVVFLLVTMLLSFFISLRMEYDEDISAFLPQDELSERYASLYQKLGSTGKIAFFFTSEKEDMSLLERISFLSDAMDDFETVWRDEDSLDCVSDVESRVTDTAIAGVLDFVTDNFPYFLNEKDYRRMDSLLTDSEYVKSRMGTIRQGMYMPSAGITSRYFRVDPLDLFSPVLGRLSNLNQAGNSRIENGFLFTEDGSTGIVFVDSPHGGSESGENAAVAGITRRVIDRMCNEHPGLTVFATGGPLVAVENASRIKKDSIMALCLSVLLISLLLFFSYKRIADVLFIALSILCGAVFSLGFISLFKSEMSVIILGIGSIIIGIAANYPLHFIDHLKYRTDKRTALADQIMPLVVGNLTTVGAFLSLTFMKAEALRSFGLVGAMLLVGTIVFVLIFLPPLFPMSKRERKTLNLDIGGKFNPGKGMSAAILAAFVILTAMFAIFSSRVKFDTDLHNINYMTSEQEKGFTILESLAFSGSYEDKIFLVAANGNLNGDVALNERVHDYMTECFPGVSMVSLYDFLPSHDRQEKALAEWESFKERHASVWKKLSVEASSYGFSSKAFQPFYGLLSRRFEVERIEYFHPLLSTVGAAMYLESEKDTSLVSYLYAPGGDSENIKSKIREQFGKDLLCFNSSDVSGRLVNALSGDFDRVGFICSILVFIFLWISFGRLELTLIAFLPLAVSWIWILGIMGIAGWKFNIVNIILATFIFGQGDDYTIFITEGLLYEYSTGKKILNSFRNSVTLSSLLMFVGIGSLIIARHPAMHSLALITMVGMITVVIMAHYLPPMLFKALTKKNGRQRVVPVTLLQFFRTVWMLTVFLAAMIVLSLITVMLFLTGPRSIKRRDQYHCLIRKVSSLALKSIPGVRCTFSGTFDDRPSVVVCNHQSHLDVLALLALTPKMVVLTNDWVWHNPFYGFLIHMAQFYPVSDGMAVNVQRLRSLVNRGYSVAVFPEGTRSEDCSILRFHRGAASLAAELQIDIQPVFIHGFGYALPKKEMMLRQADMYVEIGNRISVDSIKGDFINFTKSLRHLYEREYERIRHQRETPEYNLWLVRQQYTYKGMEPVKEAFTTLGPEALSLIASLPGNLEGVRVSSVGYGAFAILLAMSRPDLIVEAYESDEEKLIVASHCVVVPSNLKFIQGMPYGPAPQGYRDINVVDLQ